MEVDLYVYWRLEEQFAKAGYKMQNLRTGWELQSLSKKAAIYSEFIDLENGVFEVSIEGVTAYLVKTDDAMNLGTYNDHAAAGGKKVINEFLRRRYPDQTFDD